MKDTKDGDISFWWFENDTGEGRTEFFFEAQEDLDRFLVDWIIDRMIECFDENDQHDAKNMESIRKHISEGNVSLASKVLSESLGETHDWGDLKLQTYGRTAVMVMKEAVDNDGRG